ncbi:MAG: tetratricopeptide repeat protein [Promethearchaeota archaeon]
MSSIRPFSQNEINQLRKFIEKNGFHINGLIENYFRYSIGSKNKIIIFSLKFPVELALKLNIPFEIASFKVSIAFKMWNLDQNTYKVIIYFINMLKNLALQVSMEHHFPLKGKEKKLVKLLNLIIPDIIKDENEGSWLNRIRISLMNKREEFEGFTDKILKNLVDTLKKTGLEPTFKQPWELRNGIPKIRTSETLYFSNEEMEFFILEKEYFTYFKDLEYNKFYVRTFLESYSLIILINLFRDIDLFKIELYLESWIKFARLLLNSIIKIIKSGKINYNEFIQFRPEKELDSEDFELGENNFPFSALHYENSISKELFPVHTDLFNNPPSNFEIIESLSFFSEAEELINNYKFEEASTILNKALKIFNKYRQKKAVVLILLKLRKIARFLSQYDFEINYLLNALEVAKSGDVPIDYLITIYYKLGKIYFKRNFFNESLKYFNILINLLENEKFSFDKSNEFLGMAHLYIGLMYLEQKSTTEAKINLKKSMHIGNTYIKVKLKFHLLRAKFYKKKGNISQAKKFLKVIFSDINISNKNYRGIIIDLLLELAEIYIHYRKDIKKAYHFLTIIEKFLSNKTIPDLYRSLRWNLLMTDFFKKLVMKNQEFNYYQSQSAKIREKLKIIGVRENI